MTANSSSDAKTITVTSKLGKDKLYLRSLVLKDALSQPFEVRLELLHDLDPNDNSVTELDLGELLGTGITIKLELPEGRVRHIHGLVAEIEHTGTTVRSAIYSAVLRPWLWFLRYTQDCRIFQEKDVPTVLTEGIFTPHGFSDYTKKLTNTYEKRVYCVQYCESDFDFVSRLMEDEGIYYYFKHEDDKHTLVLCDSKSAHEKADGYDEIKYDPDKGANTEWEGISEWVARRAIYPGKVVTTHFNFENPKKSAGDDPLKAESSATKAPKPKSCKEDLNFFHYPGKYLEKTEGDKRAKLLREAFEATGQYHQVSGQVRGLGVGHLFTLTDHPRDSENAEYLVTSLTQELVSIDYELGSQKGKLNYQMLTKFTVLPSTIPFRPQAVTAKSRVPGLQTALVTGPASSKDGPYTDKFGRIKVRFHWDRHKSDPDEKASCWIRVANGAAGNNWGQIFIPRVGQEVIVDFLEGDPDQPIVTGVVYNKDQMPPYPLPDNATRSTIKTRSITEATDQNFNELRFEDKKGEEEVYFHAEKNFNRVVENNDTLKVGADKKDKGDQTIEIFNNQTLTVGQDGAADGSQTITILKNRSVTLKQGDDTLNVDTGKRTVTISGNDALTVKTGNHTIDISAGSQSIKAAQAISIESNQSITLKVGGNSVTIDQTGVSIKGIMVSVDGTAKLDVKSPLSTLGADGVVTVQGPLVKIGP